MRCAKISVKSMSTKFTSDEKLLDEVDEKSMLRNRYNGIPHPTQATNGKRTIRLRRHKIKDSKSGRQEDSSLPPDDHQIILNKMNKMAKPD